MPNRTLKPAPEARDKVTPEWAAAVRDAMEKRGVGLRAFAREIDVNYSTLRILINAGCKTSPHVRRVSEALGLPYNDAPMSPLAARALTAAKQLEALNPELLASFVGMLEQQYEAIEAKSGLSAREPVVDYGGDDDD